jgi:hypothetical protein
MFYGIQNFNTVFTKACYWSSTASYISPVRILLLQQLNSPISLLFSYLHIGIIDKNSALSFYLLLGFRRVSSSNEILLSHFPVIAACRVFMWRMEKLASKYGKLLRTQKRNVRTLVVLLV